ncbi:MAG: hypothetical protein K8I82_20780 [Anaerolineae bacterium]|nr:hypothetical protein [Anaerolineae bacterium]
MERTTITFNLPSDIAEKARNAGLLTDETISNLLYKEIERLAKVKEFFDVIDKLAALEPRFTLEEIEAEIQAYRNES